ncbi:hypothetical protein [Streptomyces sp. NPDC051665]|uniref:hypothetical protein n=1 Tax=Streptomyces sp. NPDC051665 TaxID=3154647 RepID=UPI003418CDDA
MPRCYGTYTVLGEELSAAELDEVCVTVADMPYADYRECRVMDLLLASLRRRMSIAGRRTLLQGAMA